MFNFPMDLFGMMNNNRRVNGTNNSLALPSLFGHDYMIPSLFGGMNNLMNSVTMMQNSTAPMHSFSSTTVMSYNSADGRPKVYQETKSCNRGPDGMEETKQSVRDTERGINKVQIGHRIGDRKHVIEREMNVQTGQISENVELENLDETEEDDFKKEWRERSAQISTRRHHPYAVPSRPQLAIEHHSSHRRPSKTTHQSNIIDLTEDDTEEIRQSSLPIKRKSSQNGSTSRKRRHE